MNESTFYSEQQEKEDETWRCEKCGKIFASKQGLSMHKTMTHKRRPKVKAKTSELDKDKLLASTFPQWVGLTTELLDGVQKWLDEAERLHKNAK